LKGDLCACATGEKARQAQKGNTFFDVFLMLIQGVIKVTDFDRAKPLGYIETGSAAQPGLWVVDGAMGTQPADGRTTRELLEWLLDA
jgi:hypothetical protein